MSVVRVEGLQKSFHRSDGATVHAVNDISFTIGEGETLALIGESGSGKSTVGRLLLRLLEADAGTIEIGGKDVRSLDRRQLRAMRSTMQIVFQEPFESLNPRFDVGSIIAEPLIIHEPQLSRSERRERVIAALEDVGLGSEHAERRPKSLSGGQQQRVGIARALASKPKFVVLDEPTSSLDLSVQAQILEILADLQADHGLSYLYISHDLSTVNYVAQRVAVMYLGQIREIGAVDAVVGHAADPYTQALMGAFLSPDPGTGREQLPIVEGEIPSPTDLPRGCFFGSRCPKRIPECSTGPIPLVRPLPEIAHDARCIRLLESSDAVLTSKVTEKPD